MRRLLSLWVLGWVGLEEGRVVMVGRLPVFRIGMDMSMK